MVALQIRSVPDSIRDTLTEEAKARGQSMQALLLLILEEHVTAVRNADILRRFSGRKDGMRAEPDEIAADIRAMREERDVQLGSSE